MPCPTCDHTLQGLGPTPQGRKHWWCPRCGTVCAESPDASRDVSVPTLVRHFAGLESALREGAAQSADWYRRAAREAAGLKEQGGSEQ